MYPTSALRRRLPRGLILAAAVLALVPILRGEEPPSREDLMRQIETLKERIKDLEKQLKEAKAKDAKSDAQLKTERAEERYIREVAGEFLTAVQKSDRTTVESFLTRGLKQTIKEGNKQTVSEWATRARPTDNLTNYEISHMSFDADKYEAIVKGAFIADVFGRSLKYPFTMRLVKDKGEGPYKVDAYSLEKR
jgi:sugar-specific transcriptional regulator TrmB